jgi:hypothetical protein
VLDAQDTNFYAARLWAQVHAATLHRGGTKAVANDADGISFVCTQCDEARHTTALDYYEFQLVCALVDVRARQATEGASPSVMPRTLQLPADRHTPLDLSATLYSEQVH